MHQKMASIQLFEALNRFIQLFFQLFEPSNWSPTGGLLPQQLRADVLGEDGSHEAALPTTAQGLTIFEWSAG